jgi:hypothetical protein
MAFVFSDPNAWMRPYWAGLHQQPFFAQLAPELQAKALAEAVEEDHPATAAQIRGCSPATRKAMLAVLDQALKEKHADTEVELWRMRNGERDVVCLAVYTVTGLDLRLLEGRQMLRTELCDNGPALLATARQWQKMMRTAGWV